MLLMMTTSVEASGAVLWRSVHSSTRLEKDESWIEEQLSAEAPVTTLDLIDCIDKGATIPPIEEHEGIEIIDSMIVEEWSEWSEGSEEPTADTPEAQEPPEAPAVEDAVEYMVTTPDEGNPMEEGLNEPVEDHIETGDTIPE